MNEKLVLKKYTVGILHCSADFAESGVVTHICEALPFPIVGSTTTSQAVNGKFGILMLTLMVMTSDDVRFAASHTTGLAEEKINSVEQSRPADVVSDMPLKLIIAFPPLCEECSGDDFVTALEATYGNVPVFGAFSVEEELMTYERNATFFNGEIYTYEMTYLLVYGDINPRFIVSNVPERSALFQVGVITKAEGNILHEINGMRTIEFFKSAHPPLCTSALSQSQRRCRWVCLCDRSCLR